MRALKIIGAFLAGLVIGEAIPICGYLIAVSYMGVFDRDGGGAMGAIFILGPMVAIVTGIILAVIVAIRTRPKTGDVQPGSEGLR